MVVRTKSIFSKKKISTKRKARKTKATSDNARKARMAQKKYIEQVVEKHKPAKESSKLSPESKKMPKFTPTQTSLPILEISEKSRKVELAQLKTLFSQRDD